MSELFYTRLIVHGVIPAAGPEEAIALLSQRLRDGIGADPDDGHREHEISIAAGAASRDRDRVEIMRVNEEFVRRLGGAK